MVPVLLAFAATALPVAVLATLAPEPAELPLLPVQPLTRARAAISGTGVGNARLRAPPGESWDCAEKDARGDDSFPLAGVLTALAARVLAALACGNQMERAGVACSNWMFFLTSEQGATDDRKDEQTGSKIGGRPVGAGGTGRGGVRIDCLELIDVGGQSRRAVPKRHRRHGRHCGLLGLSVIERRDSAGSQRRRR